MTVDYDKILRWSRRLSFVPRWVVVPTIHRQNVAEHSFHVAQTVRWLLQLHAQGDDQSFRLECIEAALDHDIDEAVTGDTPSPAKGPKDYSGLSQVQIVLKCADLLEAFAFIVEELEMGVGRAWYNPIKEDIERNFWSCWAYFDRTSMNGIERTKVLEMYLSKIVDDVWGHPVLEPK